jgi:hypothetical protein
VKRLVFETEHEQLRETARQYIEREVAPHAEKWERERIVDRSAYQAAAKYGLTRFNMPEKYGGGGSDDFRFNAVVVEELAKYGSATPALSLQNDIVGRYLKSLATDEQQQRWIPGYVVGETIGAIAMSEPGAGSDLAGIRTSAVRDGDGQGRAFCSGGDMTGADTDGAAVAANEVVQAIVGLPKPVVAGVRAAAAGFGCPLALACDLVVAARSAYFQLAFTNVGLMPDGGTSAIVVAAIGRPRAARMAILAERITASTAFEWGLISHVVDDDGYDAELTSILAAIANGPTTSYQWVKRALTAATLSPLSAVQAIEADGQLDIPGS